MNRGKQSPRFTAGGRKETTFLSYEHPAPISRRLASRRLTRAITFLTRAGRQLENASRIAPDKYNRDRLQFLAIGLRNLSVPLSKIASLLQHGGVR